MARPPTSRGKQKHRQVAQLLAQAKGDFFGTTHGGAGNADSPVWRSGQRLQTLLPQSYTAPPPRACAFLSGPDFAYSDKATARRGRFRRRRSNMEFYTWDEMEKEVLSDTIARKIPPTAPRPSTPTKT